MEKGEKPPKLDPKVWRVAAVVFLAPFMTQMDSTVVNVSLSAIREELHSSIAEAQWIITGYLLALALVLPLNGWLVDRVGAKRLYLGCFSAFTAASLLCGAARTMDELIAARVIQGIAGGLLAPMTQLMIARVAGKNFARVVGFTVIPVLLAPILGPVIAGAILKYSTWPWLFYVNLPVGILAVLLAIFLLPSDESTIQRRPFDFLGFSLLSPGLVFALYGFEHASRGGAVWFLVLGIMLILAFIWDAGKKKDRALIDLRLFKNRVFSTAAKTQFFSNGVMYAGQMLIPLYLITGCEFTASKAGWILAPMGLGMLCVSPFLGFITDRFGCRAVVVSGVVLNTLGKIPFLLMIQTGFSPALMVICMMARGAGQGITGVPSLSAAYASVEKDKLGLATTAMNIVQRLGGPVATTALAIVMSMSATQYPAAGPHAFTIAFIALIALQLMVLAFAVRLPARV
jgi:EmrB/QacA subfamily drug resistance transporter